MNPIQALIDAAEMALLNGTELADGRAVVESYSAKRLRAAIPAARAEMEKATLPESYIEDCRAKAQAWDRPTLEAQYMNAVEAVWVLNKAIADQRKPAPPKENTENADQS